MRDRGHSASIARCSEPAAARRPSPSPKPEASHELLRSAATRHATLLTMPRAMRRPMRVGAPARDARPGVRVGAPRTWREQAAARTGVARRDLPAYRPVAVPTMAAVRAKHGMYSARARALGRSPRRPRHMNARVVSAIRARSTPTGPVATHACARSIAAHACSSATYRIGPPRVLALYAMHRKQPAQRTARFRWLRSSPRLANQPH